MGEVVSFPDRRGPDEARPAIDTRAAEAALLRQVINTHRTSFPGDQAKTATQKIDGFIDIAAKTLGHGGVGTVCRAIWANENETNPARRRRDIRNAKKPKKLLEWVERIGRAMVSIKGAHVIAENDMLLDAFRGTSLDEEVARRLSGKGPEPALEQFWTLIADTLHSLARDVCRVEGLEAHLERMVALHGTYDLGADEIRPSRCRLLSRPLANWNEYVGEFPPIPSVLLFTEPKSNTIERELIFADGGAAWPVRVTVLRETRLAIGPADNVLVPAPLFEFRSVLTVMSAHGPVPVRRPWVDLEDADQIEVQFDGQWRPAELELCVDDLASSPLGGSKICGTLSLPGGLDDYARFENHYVIWRPVTAGTCRELLLRPDSSVTLGAFAVAALGALSNDRDRLALETFCPRGTLAEAIESALHVDGPKGLPALLRAEAHRMVTMLRAWHEARGAAADAAHQGLRNKWKDWS
ncbi:hypothetical protein ACQW02_15830 [Humitalea sp. 24SJ18S-53]|uniref:hypothetical protein n=1 Tax=Humitalea sp. 24SJ18S-53 TaxID=3422307 RepID=UPI003D663FB7